jgi:putative chitinase
MLTIQQFAAAVQCTLMTADTWHPHIEVAMVERAINTPRRIAMFLAQVAHESGNLNHVEENLNYSAQRLCEVWPRRFQSVESARFFEHCPERLANLLYGSRMGNGAYESGDGWKYHGRGPIQITGATNYRRCGVALNAPLIERPELLLDPKLGAKSAAWFWEDSGCNEAADAENVEAVTRRINGGLIGLEDRRARYQLALKVLG